MTDLHKQADALRPKLNARAGGDWLNIDGAEANALIRNLLTALAASEARAVKLRLDVATQEALQVSAYHAGLKAGWNFCVNEDSDGFQAATASTEHIEELRRVRDARQALKDTDHADL